MSNTVSHKQNMPQLQKSSLLFSILKIHQQSKRVYIYKTSKNLIEFTTVLDTYKCKY